MPNAKWPVAALSIFCYVKDVQIAVGLTSEASFPHFADHFMKDILEGHRDGVTESDLARRLRLEVQDWVEVEDSRGLAERNAKRVQAEARVPWYQDHPEGRKEHARAVQALASVRRALQIVEPNLDLDKVKGMQLAKVLARAARVVDYRMIPVFVMVAERETITTNMIFGHEPESTGYYINTRLRKLRGLPSRG
ncbi:hypothetical protein [Salinibacterium sp. SWN1162]|uniref:hypothetical protein n=1 Tax=Salinibacterium sp. SWN1162 TaxID=2792053 RepID=UPI0018CE73EE|nr:hypothetical protein [Salinibacterium sp. SWN1162]MBH0009571.1 hypothetical protein [Salinibacterium sp. SWN1162]